MSCNGTALDTPEIHGFRQRRRNRSQHPRRKWSHLPPALRRSRSGRLRENRLSHCFSPVSKFDDLHEALELVRQMDPPGVACRDLRDCLLYQLRYHQAQLATHKNGNGEATAQVLTDAVAIVDQHLRALQNKQYKEIARAIGRTPEAVQEALDYIRTLDPRPGLRYNKASPA